MWLARSRSRATRRPSTIPWTVTASKAGRVLLVFAGAILGACAGVPDTLDSVSGESVIPEPRVAFTADGCPAGSTPTHR